MFIIRNIIKILTVSALTMPLLACNSSDFTYISREDLDHDPLYISEKSDMKLPKNYGAVKLTDSQTDNNKGSLFIIQKKKGAYQAETMFLSNRDKKLYFSLGMDYRQKTPRVGFRVEF